MARNAVTKFRHVTAHGFEDIVDIYMVISIITRHNIAWPDGGRGEAQNSANGLLPLTTTIPSSCVPLNTIGCCTAHNESKRYRIGVV